MDYKPNGLLMRCVLINLILNCQWMMVFSAPTHSGSTVLDRAKSLTKLLGQETSVLLEAYSNSTFQQPPEDFTEEIPESKISGDTVAERLQNVYVTNQIFSRHILQVRRYLVEVFGNPKSVVGPLKIVTSRLLAHSVKIKTVLEEIYPNAPLPPTPAPPPFPENDSYAQREYGLRIITGLKEWHRNVLEVLNECQKQMQQV